MTLTAQHPNAQAEVAAAKGFPPTLFGFDPGQRAYWFEPGLPFAEHTAERPPLTADGFGGIWCPCIFMGDGMAPRFPAGVLVHTDPVAKREGLQVGRVYTYEGPKNDKGERVLEAGRLVKIWGNCLEVALDNGGPDAPRIMWPLRETPGEEFWDVREVTFYLSYPGEDE